ncbi:MAG: DsbC family protein [Deltaproteobacteria bacterium]|nr:DsbC family protein [Deltaproteobacteria bacterium]
MKKTELISLVVSVICVFVLTSFLIINYIGDSRAPAAVDTKDNGVVSITPTVAGLQEIYPRMKVDNIQESEIPGLYEITAGSNILYYYPEKNYLLFGEIMTEDGKNLTAEKRNLIFAASVEKIDIENALKIGSGKTKVIEITNPDCGYCRKLSKYWERPEIRERVTRYVMFASFDPRSLKKTEYIMSASDGEAAVREVMSGKLDKIKPDKITVTEKGKDFAKKQREILSGLNIRGTPTLLIDGEVIMGADIKKIERALKIDNRTRRRS